MKKNLYKIRIIRETAGFTMVELLISLAVFAMLTAVITPIYKQGTGYWQAAKIKTELRQNLNLAMEIIAREIRQANGVTIDGNTVKTNSGETIARYSTDGVMNYIILRGETGKQYIELNSEAITSTTMINITSAQVREISAEEGIASGTRGYEITIWGEYAGNSALHEADKRLKVQTRVFSRAVHQIESWHEYN